MFLTLLKNNQIKFSPLHVSMLRLSDLSTQI